MLEWKWDDINWQLITPEHDTHAAQFGYLLAFFEFWSKKYDILEMNSEVGIFMEIVTEYK